jgi:hypothetical protein
MARTAIYDSNQVDLIIGAIPIKDGRAQTFVKVSKDEDTFGTAVGADGHVVRFHTHNPLWTVEVSLVRSSEHNQQLSVLHALDDMSSGGAGMGVLMIKDGTGATLYASDRCWIKHPADGEFGKEVGECTWTFQCVMESPVALLGGN